MDLGLQDKVVWVTGGASGIGEAIVRVLAAEGAIPVIIDRDRERALRLQQQLGGRTDHAVGDLTDDFRLAEIAADLLVRHGRIDGLVNNAGWNDAAGLDADAGAFRRSLERNLVHAFALVHHVAGALRASRGSIVNIASKVALTGQGRTSGYAAAKGGLLSLTREWALEFAPDGVRVNAVLPAEVWTPMYEAWLSDQTHPEEKRRSIEERIPLERRMTTPEEIAATVVFLLSRCSSHTTGQWLHVDGGYVHLDRAFPPAE